MKRSSRWSFALLIAFLFVFATTPVFAATNVSSSTLLDTIKQRSVKAKTLNSQQFAVGSSLNDVEDAWGPAEDLSTVAANYWTRNIRFLYDGNTPKRTITAIDDFDPQLQTIRLKQVKQKFGKPISAVEQEGNYYVTYKANNNHHITFVFQSKFTNNNPTLEMYTISSVQ
ncbi:DUF4309 domain-containing protein [Shimazuella kribbensis]|uniref:DUF4309 domain-containing protein n=1 Tax=Shimazuella kribbensis TaxID=139808 RepID=UPI0004281E78|nr:DUF4309 domain-containing protein [Shimazuella kribbensis]